MYKCWAFEMLRYLDVELSSFGNVAFMSKCWDAEMSRCRNVELLRDVEISRSFPGGIVVVFSRSLRQKELFIDVHVYTSINVSSLVSWSLVKSLIINPRTYSWYNLEKLGLLLTCCRLKKPRFLWYSWSHDVWMQCTLLFASSKSTFWGW